MGHGSRLRRYQPGSRIVLHVTARTELGNTSALAIERVTDLALREVPTVEPGILFVERQFGVLEVHGGDLADVERTSDVLAAREAMGGVLASVAGRDHPGGRHAAS
jgi:hypothetical protein